MPAASARCRAVPLPLPARIPHLVSRAGTHRQPHITIDVEISNLAIDFVSTPIIDVVFQLLSPTNVPATRRCHVCVCLRPHASRAPHTASRVTRSLRHAIHTHTHTIHNERASERERERERVGHATRHTLSLTHTASHDTTHTHTRTQHKHSLSLSLSHTHTHTHTHTRTHAHTQRHTTRRLTRVVLGSG